MIASFLTKVYITGGFSVIPCGPYLACGGYICDVAGHLDTVAYPSIRIFFYIDILSSKLCVS